MDSEPATMAATSVMFHHVYGRATIVRTQSAIEMRVIRAQVLACTYLMLTSGAAGRTTR